MSFRFPDREDRESKISSRTKRGGGAASRQHRACSCVALGLLCLLTIPLLSSCARKGELRPAQASTPSSPSAQSERTRLRVCADPNNLPFSNDRLEGFENKIAALVARELHA